MTPLPENLPCLSSHPSRRDLWASHRGYLLISLYWDVLFFGVSPLKNCRFLMVQGWFHVFALPVPNPVPLWVLLNDVFVRTYRTWLPVRRALCFCNYKARWCSLRVFSVLLHWERGKRVKVEVREKEKWKQTLPSTSWWALTFESSWTFV